jgi:23S rRNA pseudouridine1911/1915/1917 synthase
MTPEIIFENSDYIIINKPAGLVVHSDGKTVERTLVDWIKENHPEIEGVGEPMIISNKGAEQIIDRPGIVHRLDRETSGVLIIAKNPESFDFFKNAFKNHQIQKTYNAIVWGHVKDDEGKINAPIGRSKSDFRKWSAQRGARGTLRPAETDYKVLGRFEMDDFSSAKGHGGTKEKFSFLELSPKTGRTHQIRVHMKYFNHPIICDTLYAENKPKVLGFDRVALHARKIAFVDPSGEEKSFEAPYPEDFLNIMGKI